MKSSSITRLLPLLLLPLLAWEGCTRQTTHQNLDAASALTYCDQQVHRALAQLSASGAIDTTLMPRNIAVGDSAWSCREVCAEEWCSGFWPGILWMDYEAASAPDVRRAALDATQAMHRIVDRPVFDHDLGFLIFCSAGTGMRVLTKELQRTDLSAEERAEDEAALAQYRDFCLRAADSLATLYNPTVGTILSWPRNIERFGGHNTIMDNMINLEMLCWAANQLSEDSVHSRQLYDIAVTHAKTTMQNHFRPDCTSYHVAVYDTLDGHFIHGVTHQGYADHSMWARGQSWAIYGFTMMTREVRQSKVATDKSIAEDFLRMACGAADAYLAQLPADYVPYWDFSDPRIATSPSIPAPPSETIAPRDASAAAVVASALLELSTLVADDALAPDGTTARSAYYRDAAEKMLNSLTSDAYKSGQQNSAFLLHSTGNHPKNSEIDIPIIYADYYFIEALLRYKEMTASN